MSLSMYTFANEPYVPGVVAFINSVRSHGFSGTIHVGSPEPLSICNHASQSLIFNVLGPSAYWPGNRKAELLLSHARGRFAFFDADMIVTQPTLFSKIESWIDVAPVFSVAHVMVPIDHRRHTWARRLKRPAQSDRWPIFYFNSGFFAGLFERDRPLIKEWDAAIRQVLTPPGLLATDPDFITSDQDVLNAVLQDWEGQIIGIGAPDIYPLTAIPFSPFIPYSSLSLAILHCSGGLMKPWTMTTPPPRSPGPYELAWYDHVIARRTPISIPDPLPPSMRRWLERKILSRVTVAYHRLMKFLRGLLG
jgi:hypothetical protein